MTRGEHACVGMAAIAFRAHGGRGLDRDRVMAEPGQPRRIPAGASTRVQHQRRSRRQQAVQPGMHLRRVLSAS